MDTGPRSASGLDAVPPFDKYHVLAELGRGGMATVYLAVVVGPGGFNKLVVLKQLLPCLADDSAACQAFLEEGKLADFIVVDRDVLTCPLDDLKETQVIETYLGGRLVHPRAGGKPAER